MTQEEILNEATRLMRKHKGQKGEINFIGLSPEEKYAWDGNDFQKEPKQ